MAEKQTFILGLIGGVGAGKSTVLTLLKDHYGFYVIQTDLTARRLLEPGEAAFEEIAALFGREMCIRDRLAEPGKNQVCQRQTDHRPLCDRSYGPGTGQLKTAYTLAGKGLSGDLPPFFKYFLSACRLSEVYPGAGAEKGAFFCGI